MVKYIKCSEIIDVRDGTHDSPKYINDEGYPLVTSKNIKENKIDFENINFISAEDFKKINQRSEVVNGDIIMPMIGTIGNPVLVNTDRVFAIKNVALFKIADNEKVDGKFFYYVLKSENIVKQLDKKKRGGTQSFVSLTNIRELKIPNINIEQQRNIVRVLDAAQNLVDKRKEQIIALDELVKSKFIEMFDNGEYNRYELISLVKEGAGLSYGIVVPGENVEDGIEMIRPLNFDNGKIKLDSLYKVDRSIEEKYAKTRLLGDELLIQVIGNPGEVVLTIPECEGMNVTRNLAVIRQNNEIVNKYYLREYLKSWEAQSFMKSGTNQSTLKQLPLATLKKLSVQLPPIELQNQFADFVKQVDKLKADMEDSLRGLEDNFNSLMQRAFKGELF